MDAGIKRNGRLCRGMAAKIEKIDQLDERTWLDLEMDKVFVRLDQAETPLGSQHLYAVLRQYERDPSRLADNIQLYQTFAKNPALRARVKRALRVVILAKEI
jgi:hypothetical protein